MKNASQVKVVVRLPNWIGDALMSYPLLIGLQRSGVNFVCVGHPWAKELFAATEFDVVSSSEVKSVKWAYKFYKKNKFDFAISCPKTLSSILPMKLAGIKTIGYHGFSSTRLSYNDSLHTVENYFELGKSFFDPKLTLEQINDTVPVGKQEENQAKLIIEKQKHPYVVICPYATNLHKGKNKEWPNWKEFCEKYTAYSIIAMVSPNDLNRCKIEYPNIPCVSANIPVTGQVMKQAKFVLANDSGAMHIASFFGANVIGLFGATEIQKTRPWFGTYYTAKDGGFISLNDLISLL